MKTRKFPNKKSYMPRCGNVKQTYTGQGKKSISEWELKIIKLLFDGVQRQSQVGTLLTIFFCPSSSTPSYYTTNTTQSHKHRPSLSLTNNANSHFLEYWYWYKYTWASNILCTRLLVLPPVLRTTWPSHHLEPPI